MEGRRVRKRGVRDNREEVERGRMRHGREKRKEETGKETIKRR